MLLLLNSCMTVPKPEEIPEDLPPEEYFQRAQEEVDNYNWEAALVYYKTFLERHQDNPGRIVAAEYEIAFINYKIGNYDTAETQFMEILEKYEAAAEGELPARFRVLSEKVLAMMHEEENPEEEEQE